MEIDETMATPDRRVCLGATYVVSKEAKCLRDLKNEVARFAFPDEEGFNPASLDAEAPPREVLELLEKEGAEWEISLFDTTFPAPYLAGVVARYPSADIAAVELATNGLIARGVDLEDIEQYQDLIDQMCEMMGDAFNRASKFEKTLLKLPGKLENEAARLCDLKSAAIEALEIPLVGFRHDPDALALYALLGEDEYCFHVPLQHFFVGRSRNVSLNHDDGASDYRHFDENYWGDCSDHAFNLNAFWGKTGIPSVDAIVKHLNRTGELPAFAESSTDRPLSTCLDEGKSLGLSVDEAVTVLIRLLKSTAV